MTKQRKTKTPPIHQYDRVRIVVPQFFVRCGYPLDFAGEVENLVNVHRDTIAAFLVEFGVRPGNSFDGSNYAMNQAVEKVARAITYPLIRQKGFGGKERKIYTHEFPELAGVETEVVARPRFVKTGTWERGCGGEEPEPNWLSNEKSHRILLTRLYGLIPGKPFATRLEIDAANVELVRKYEE